MQGWSSRQKAKGRRRPGVEANGTAWNQETLKNRLGVEADLVGKGRAKGRRRWGMGEATAPQCRPQSERSEVQAQEQAGLVSCTETAQ